MLNHLSLYQSNICYLWEVKPKKSLMEIFSPFSHVLALKYQLTSTALMMITQLSLTTSQITWSRKEFNSVSQVVSINTHRQGSVTEPAERCPRSWEQSRAGERERGKPLLVPGMTLNHKQPARVPGWTEPREEKSLNCTAASTGWSQMRWLMQDACSTESEGATPAPGEKRGFHKDKQIGKKNYVCWSWQLGLLFQKVIGMRKG